MLISRRCRGRVTLCSPSCLLSDNAICNSRPFSTGNIQAWTCTLSTRSWRPCGSDIGAGGHDANSTTMTPGMGEFSRRTIGHWLYMASHNTAPERQRHITVNCPVVRRCRPIFHSLPSLFAMHPEWGILLDERGVLSILGKILRYVVEVAAVHNFFPEHLFIPSISIGSHIYLSRLENRY